MLNYTPPLSSTWLVNPRDSQHDDLTMVSAQTPPRA